MSVEPFRRDVAKTLPADIPGKLEVYVYELNLLMRLARANNIAVSVDTVERAGYTEILIDCR